MCVCLLRACVVNGSLSSFLIIVLTCFFQEEIFFDMYVSSEYFQLEAHLKPTDKGGVSEKRTVEGLLARYKEGVVAANYPVVVDAASMTLTTLHPLPTKGSRLREFLGEDLIASVEATLGASTSEEVRGVVEGRLRPDTLEPWGEWVPNPAVTQSLIEKLNPQGACKFTVCGL